MQSHKEEWPLGKRIVLNVRSGLDGINGTLVGYVEVPNYDDYDLPNKDAYIILLDQVPASGCYKGWQAVVVTAEDLEKNLT